MAGRARSSLGAGSIVTRRRQLVSRLLIAWAVAALGVVPARGLDIEGQQACLGGSCSFAVFVMPDTQGYASDQQASKGGGEHLKLFTEYVCRNRTAWTEPGTGKVMPILAVLALGDMVTDGSRASEWNRVDAAFDRLDAEDCRVPYVVAFGNHDRDGTVLPYQGSSLGWESVFGINRWTHRQYECEDPANCSGRDGDWFIDELGPAEDIPANSRNKLTFPPPFPGGPGPAMRAERRHRAVVLRLPNLQRWLFLALEDVMDFPLPPPHDALGFFDPEPPVSHTDGSRWPIRVLDAYPNLTTVLVTHGLIDATGSFAGGRPADFFPDISCSEPPCYEGPSWGKTLWKRVVENAPGGEPHTGVALAFNGHHQGNEAERLGESIPAGPEKPSGEAQLILRNYQLERHPTCLNQPTGAGWNTIAVFDTEKAEIRIRSHRIDSANCTHTGTPTIRASDFGSFRQVVLRNQFFPDLRPGALDNCFQPLDMKRESSLWRFFNPSQNDTDCDGFGNTCDCNFEDLEVDPFEGCGISDFNLFLQDFQTGVDSGRGTDMNSDGFVSIADFNLFLPGFIAGSPGIRSTHAPPDPDCTDESEADVTVAVPASAAALSAREIRPIEPIPENQPMLDFLELHVPDSPFLPSRSRQIASEDEREG